MNETIVINVVNRKGGVYKSTIAVHLACGLAIRGNSVAIVDADSQGHVSALLGYEPRDGLYNVLIDKVAPLQEVVHIPTEVYSPPDNPSQGNLYMLPGYKKTYRISALLQSGDSFIVLDTFEALGASLAESTGRGLDYVIVDSQPSMTSLDISMFMATDAFIIPTALEVLSFDGMQDLIEEIKAFTRSRQRHLGRNTFIAGLIPTIYREGTASHEHNKSQLEDYYKRVTEGGLVLPPVKQRTIWTQAAVVREPMFLFAPSSDATLEMWNLINVIEMRVKQWQTAQE